MHFSYVRHENRIYYLIVTSILKASYCMATRNNSYPHLACFWPVSKAEKRLTYSEYASLSGIPDKPISGAIWNY